MRSSRGETYKIEVPENTETIIDSRYVCRLSSVSVLQISYRPVTYNEFAGQRKLGISIFDSTSTAFRGFGDFSGIELKEFYLNQVADLWIDIYPATDTEFPNEWMVYCDHVIVKVIQTSL